MPFSLRRSTQKPVASCRDREHERLQLVGAALAHPAGLAVGEGRQQRARVADPVAVVEVVDRDLAVEEHGLLDAPEAEQPDVEVVVLLRASDAEGQVVGTADRSLVGHRTVSSCALCEHLYGDRHSTNAPRAAGPFCQLAVATATGSTGRRSRSSAAEISSAVRRSSGSITPRSSSTGTRGAAAARLIAAIVRPADAQRRRDRAQADLELLVDHRPALGADGVDRRAQARRGR